MTRDKFINWIREVLRRTILPIRHKKEVFLSNFRLSIAFRISMSYLRLLITHGVLLIIGIFILYMYEEKKDFDKIANNIIISLQEEKLPEIINPYYNQGISMVITNMETGKEEYDDTSYLPNDQVIFHSIHYNSKNDQNILMFDEERELSNQQGMYKAKFQYDLTKSYQDFLSLIWKILILYGVLIILIMRKGIRSDAKLFEPIRIMSATANRLTVNNLHSQRLNVEGTKNELKDLANVFNQMLDRLETSYESQKQFVSDASHELRTPIAVIQGYANMLARWGSSNEEVLEESIEAIQNESRAMQDLVEKLLYLSRHDKKTFKLTKKKFNMKPIVEDMVRETKLLAPNRIVQSPKMENVIVYGDKQALKQAIRIFIDNAVKYSKDGDEVNIFCENINGDCVITIQDTGIGMTRNDLDHIFDRFYRSDEVRNKSIGGHGLGLSLAKIIVLSHIGKIKVRSQFTKGTSFIITIPKRNF